MKKENRIVKILGVDPGLRTTGYARINYDQETNEVWLDQVGVLRCHPSFKGLQAVSEMIKNSQQFSNQIFKEDPDFFDFCVIEFPAAIYNPNFSSGAMMPMAGVSGALYCSLTQEHPSKEFILVHPSTWNSRKKKAKTSQIIQEIFGEVGTWEFREPLKATTLYEHVIDAASMAYWYLDKHFIEGS